MKHILSAPIPEAPDHDSMIAGIACYCKDPLVGAL
jgi:hypothetical protein